MKGNKMTEKEVDPIYCYYTMKALVKFKKNTEGTFEANKHIIP